jgi:tRNA(His) 5'-end guanylyltransferase
MEDLNMPVNDELGKRMKEFYEARARTYLPRRTPVAIRIDGKAFHTFTRGFQKPFDEVLGNSMVRTMEYCAKNIGNCVFAYCQSDEITFILVDYAKLETDAWFDYRTDKLCSVAASMATMAFNQFFKNEVDKFYYNHCSREDPLFEKHYQTYRDAQYKGAMFDSRCFNIPKEEVCNLIYWRQLDATRNSIQMMGQANFSHAELQGKSCNDIQDMLMEKKNINWNNTPTPWKRGTAWRKDFGTDFNMPILKGEDRAYVDDLIFIGE